MKIVVVDDDLLMLSLMGQLLESRGCEVTLSHSGLAEALDVPNENPGGVVTNLSMAGLDGLGLVGELRKNPKLRQLKIIMVTSQSDADTEIVAKAAGVDDFIGKPIDSAKFADRVIGVIADNSAMAGD